MGVTKLSKVSLIVPRSEVPAALRELSEFGMFHPSQPHSESYDPKLDELSSKAFRTYIALGEIIRDTKLQMEPSVLEILMKGYNVPKEKFTATDWEDLVSKAEADAKPLIDEISRALGEAGDAEKRLQSELALKEALKLVSEFSIDFRKFTALKRFHVVFAVITAKDLPEIRKSLPDSIVIDATLTKTESVVVVAAPKSRADLVEKVLRSFEVEPFSITSDLPQNPAEAYKAIQQRVAETEKNLELTKQKLDDAVKSSQSKILALYEISKSAYEILNEMKKSGDLRRMAIIQGYIPHADERRFKETFGRWITVAEEVRAPHDHHGEEHAPPIPTLMSNPSFTSSFEVIALNQGAPRYGEIDPTTIISLIFPIFYGIMFGDFGHGMVILLFGLLLLQRKAPGLKKWGVMFSLAGVSASVVGLLIGEAFGLEIKTYVPALGQLTLVEMVERFHEGVPLAVPTINTATLKLMLKISMILGIIHLFIGNIIAVLNEVRNKAYAEMIAERIPSLTMYLGFVLLLFAIVGARFQVFGAFADFSTPTPFFFFFNGPPIGGVAVAGTVILVGSLIFYIVGKPLFIRMGKLPKEPIGMAVLQNVIEGIFEKVPGFLSNTVSYVRLAILLSVHAALLIALNIAWSLGTVAIPLIIVCNILIILLEGMIVFIQDLRLHLYEWFTKFYGGTGIPFRQLSPVTIRSEIEWKK